jgi:hypothetical protein
VNGSVIIATPSTAKPTSQGYPTLHIDQDLQQQMACIFVNLSPNSIQHNKPVGKGRQQYIVKNSDIVRYRSELYPVIRPILIRTPRVHIK